MSMPVRSRTSLPTRRAWSKTACKDRPDGLAGDRRLVGVADLPEDLPFPQDQALQAGGHLEQVRDGPTVMVVDQVRREALCAARP